MKFFAAFSYFIMKCFNLLFKFILSLFFQVTIAFFIVLYFIILFNIVELFDFEVCE